MDLQPWDKTSVVVALLNDDGTVGKEEMRMCRDGANLQCPQYSCYSDLYVIADCTDWWNIYKVRNMQHLFLNATTQKVF